MPVCLIMPLMQKTYQKPGDARPDVVEALRCALLREMGIVPLYQRGSRQQSAPAPVSEIALNPGPEKLPDEMPAESNAVVEPPRETVEDFAFSWLALDSRLAVLAMLPAGASQLPAALQKMLQNIVIALNPAYRQCEMREHTFHWPLPDDLGLPADKTAAIQTVSGFIARRMREQAVSNVLVLADNELFFLDRGEVTADTGFGLSPQFGFALLQTHSLFAMQDSPDLKRSAWSAMQALIPRLATPAD